MFSPAAKGGEAGAAVDYAVAGAACDVTGVVDIAETSVVAVAAVAVGDFPSFTGVGLLVDDAVVSEVGSAFVADCCCSC